jgi:hypothetical protein
MIGVRLLSEVTEMTTANMTVAEVSQFVRDNSSIGLSRFWGHVAGGDMHPMSRTDVERTIRQLEGDTDAGRAALRGES